MCEKAIEDVDEAEDGGGKARHEDDIKLKYPGVAEEGCDEGEYVTKDEEDEGSDSRGLRADSRSGILLESGGEYEETGDCQLGSLLWVHKARRYPIIIKSADNVAAALQYHSVWSFSV